MYFTRLRLVGFKSFVEQTELAIEPGLTGVVGPNGCGKSNLVEALRWVMGETSARQMRGGEMDDVIFGGTNDRPARNLAEVQLAIDNADRRAPASFNDLEEIEVVRRIERGEGSAYRVNGRDVRARDVQLLFADAATGAHSPSLVSQGRVGALINAKPVDRRSILEDAAGIAGLHSRRHEAELRLKAAETNLGRLEDVLTTLDTQLQGLKKQARQAARYRTVSESIRKLEAVLLALHWSAAIKGREEAAAALELAEQAVAEATSVAAQAATVQANGAASLPPLRQAEVEAAAELHRLTLASGELEAEARRIGDATRAVAERLLQIGRDVERETQLAQDAEAALARLAEEEKTLIASQDSEQESLAEAAAALGTAEGETDTADQLLSQASQKLAANEVMRASIDRRLGDLANRQGRLTREQEQLAAQRSRVAAELVSPQRLNEARDGLGSAAARLDEARAALETSAAARQAASAAESEAARNLQGAEGALARLVGEIAGIAASLEAPVKSGGGVPVLDEVSVTPGYEAALAAAFGDDLTATAAENSDSPTRWIGLPPRDAGALPGGAEPLTQKVTAPSALARGLAATGIVADAGTGHAQQRDLGPGQRLVSKDGDLWRWDGFFRAAGAPSEAQTRLAQRNRLAHLTEERGKAEALRQTHQSALDRARAAAATAQADEAAARSEERAAALGHDHAQTGLNRLEAAASSAEARLAGLDGTLARLATDLGEAQQEQQTIEAQRAEMPDPALAREEVARLRADLNDKRGALSQIRNRHDDLVRETELRRRRLAAIEEERAGWQRRQSGTAQRLSDLAGRREAGLAEQASLADEPGRVEMQRKALAERIQAAEQRRRDEADRLAAAETVLAEADRALRAAESELGQVRESRVRAEAMRDAAVKEAQSVAERIREKVDCAPEEVAGVAELGEDLLEWPDPQVISTRLERQIRERDNIGAVNLRAEEESAELEEQITGMTTERDDLVQAIARLRSGIAQLNREGKERLNNAFDTVNNHFQELFVRLFGGGRAHLQLTESEDPLAAGLEILASPPGKKLQALSLLSGGEQALTALALIFAVFLTNPSPICVLDEVDAPLDDANVDRFCSLLDDISRSTGTRFLVITHHRMTMARMDRLFGVTMVERGVSQLVSVDLARAERLRVSQPA